MKKITNGFTIVELLIIIIIIGTLATIGLVSFSNIRADSRDSQRSSRISIIAEALEKYYEQNGEYPSCNAMSQSPSAITTGTLKGIAPDVLAVPTDASGTNSILPSCTELTAGTDKFAYVGDGSGPCVTGTGQAGACLQYTLKYREESTGQIKTLTSRHTLIPLTAIATISGATTVGSVLTAGALTPSGATVTYQWQSATTSGGTYTNISSATASTYTLVMGDLAKYIKVVATATGNYTGTQTSVASAVVSDSDWLTIGTQVWAKANLNEGTMLANGSTMPTDDGIVQKWCYSNNPANCTTDGGLYQWDEAMQYVTTNGAQGICPTGSHIPTDNDWKILEIQLGMTQAQADDTSYRGTNQGTQLKPSGTSGLNIPLAGYRTPPGGSFNNLSSYVGLWSSSESSTSAWRRFLHLGSATVARTTYDKAYGFSVRCVGN